MQPSPLNAVFDIIIVMLYLFGIGTSLVDDDLINLANLVDVIHTDAEIQSIVFSARHAGQFLQDICTKPNSNELLHK